jgi:hypothetical protein
MIRKCYEKFLTLFKKNSNPTEKKVPHKSIGYIKFDLLDNYSVDIDLSVPKSSLVDPVGIASVSERYAEFLFLINQGLFKERIIEVLQDKIDPNNDSSYLVFDNIITFWGLLFDEYKKGKKEYSQLNQPVIKPSQVFKSNV